MEVKGSAFSLRIGKDIKENRSSNTEAFKVDRKYKKFDEQKVERRFNNNYTEKEVYIEKPVAPPRSKRDKRQSFRDFKDEQTRLFQSDHQTEEGTDLLPVSRTIAFDCPTDGVDKKDIHISIIGPGGSKCPTQINLNHDGTFTCEFSTSMVGEHTIEIIISDERLNVTPSFYTYDASKIKVGQIPMGYVGLPVEFDSKYSIYNSDMDFAFFLDPYFWNFLLLLTFERTQSKKTMQFGFIKTSSNHRVLFLNAGSNPKVSKINR